MILASVYIYIEFAKNLQFKIENSRKNISLSKLFVPIIPLILVLIASKLSMYSCFLPEIITFFKLIRIKRTIEYTQFDPLTRNTRVHFRSVSFIVDSRDVIRSTSGEASGGMPDRVLSSQLGHNPAGKLVVHVHPWLSFNSCVHAGFNEPTLFNPYVPDNYRVVGTGREEGGGGGGGRSRSWHVSGNHFRLFL